MKKITFVFFALFAMLGASIAQTTTLVTATINGTVVTVSPDPEGTTLKAALWAVVTDDNRETITQIVIENPGEGVEVACEANLSYLFSDTHYNSAYHYNYYEALLNIDGLVYVNTENVTDMSAMFYGCDSLPSLDLSNFNTENVTDMGCMFYGCDSLSSLNISNFNTENVTTMTQMFSHCISLPSLDLSHFNTDSVTNMSDMFSSCYSLSSIDISNFNTENVTDMHSMFNFCSSLSTIDLSNFNTENVTNMSWLFGFCRSLTSLDLSSFNTDNVTNMGAMFSYCSSLPTINLSNFNTDNVTSMGGMFRDCGSLPTIDLSSFNTDNVTSMGGMFDGCSLLPAIDLSNFNTENVTNMSYMFSDCSSLPTLDLSNFITDNVTNMSYMFSGCSSFPTIDLSNFNTENVTNMGGMFSGCSSFLTIDLSIFNTENVTDMGSMFYNCSSLPTIDLSNFNTENVMYMNSMFSGCSLLPTIDLSNFNTDNVTTMSSMFSGCSSFSALDLSNFNTENVVYMSSMFSGCSLLPTIDLSNFNTDNVTTMSSMFSGCSSLPTLDLSNFNTDNVTDMSSMFSGCRALPALDLSNFNTENVVYMSSMFSYCDSLSSLVLSNFNTENVTTMHSMFRDCSSLVSLDLSNFNAENVTTMSYMFYNCSSLVSLDLSNFSTENLEYMSSVFSGCRALPTLDLSNFNTDNVTTMSEMFRDCSSLTSLNLSNFNTENVVYMRYLFYHCSSLASLDISNFNTANLYEYNGSYYRGAYGAFAYVDSLTRVVIGSNLTQNISDQIRPASGGIYGSPGIWKRESDGNESLLIPTTDSLAAAGIYHAKKLTYTLSFDINYTEGVDPTDMTVTYTEPIGFLPTPVREGHTFTGWFFEETLITETTVWNFKADSIAVAHWSINDYTLLLDANGGTSPEPTTLTITYGTQIGALPNSARTGYTFAGWQIGAELISDTSIWNYGADQTAVALWNANTYTLNFDANYSGGTNPAAITVSYDAEIGTLPTPTRTGYAFEGWQIGDEEITATTVWSDTTAQTAIATWSANSYTLSFDANYPGGANPTSMSVTYDAEVEILPGVMRVGYTFVGWKIGGTEILETTVWNYASNQTAVAQWSANTYTLFFDANYAEGEDPTEISTTYDNAIGALPTVTRDGYIFDGWFIGEDLITASSVWIYPSDETAEAGWTIIPCDPPVNISAELEGPTAITVSWEGTVGNYRVRYRELNTSSWTTKTAPASPYTITDLIAGVWYQVQVESVCENNSSEWLPELPISLATELQLFAIFAEDHGLGTIAPAGVSQYPAGARPVYTFVPLDGGQLDSVLVSGVLTPIVDNTYQFSALTKNETIEAFFTPQVSISENDLHNAIRLYPNPATSQITLAADNVTITHVDIVDLTGRVILQKVINQDNTINIQAMERGVYFARISTTDGIVSLRFIKQ